MVLVFFAMIGINLNWAIVADITLVRSLIIYSGLYIVINVCHFCLFVLVSV